MKRLLTMVLPGSLGLTLSAQKTQDILVLSGRYGFPASYKDSYAGEATEYGALNSLTAGFNLTRQTMFAVNVNHFYFNVPGDPAIPDHIANPMVLNGIIIRMGIIQKLGNGRKLQLLIAPRLMSDFRNLDRNSFQLGGIATYQRTFHEDLTVGFGAMYNQELFGPYMVPLLIIDWNLSSRFNINGMLPITARINYKVNDGLSVGFNHFGLSTSFYMGDEDYEGDYIERLSIDLSLYARKRLFGNFYIEGMAGRSMARKYKQYGGDQKVDFAIPLIAFGDTRTVKNVTFNDGIILQLKLIFNLPVPD